MNLSNIVSILGAFYPEERLTHFLGEFGLSEKPKLPRDDTSTYLLRHDLGIELILTSERYLNNRSRSYPEGALVLESVGVYGAKDSTFARFDGMLPHSLQFGMTLEELSEKFGKPTRFDDELATARWDLSDHSVFADFDDDGRADIYSFQPPVVDD